MPQKHVKFAFIGIYPYKYTFVCFRVQYNHKNGVFLNPFVTKKLFSYISMTYEKLINLYVFFFIYLLFIWIFYPIFAVSSLKYGSFGTGFFPVPIGL